MLMWGYVMISEATDGFYLFRNLLNTALLRSRMQLKTIPEDFVVAEVARHEVRPQGQYALVEMTKRNMSTERALAEVADFMGVPRRFVGYAGTKDSRALTKQFITVKTVDVERIKKLRRDNIVLRHIGFVDEPIGLGMLEANRFEIVIRKMRSEALHELTSIPNYFDEQRFSTANAEIGKLIIAGEYLKAAQRIIGTAHDVAPQMQEHLERRPNDAVSALRIVPKHTLLMYVHAYQSLLWNEVLARYVSSLDAMAIAIDGPVRITAPSKELGPVDIPIFGFGTEEHPVFGKWYAEILEREGIEPRDFVVRALPFLSVEGSTRPGFFRVGDFHAGPREPDEMNPGFEKQRLTFTLPKSCYATMAIKVLYRVGRVQGETT
jgi:tRNA pseudouridine13 synthase